RRPGVVDADAFGLLQERGGALPVFVSGPDADSDFHVRYSVGCVMQRMLREWGGVRHGGDGAGALSDNGAWPFEPSPSMLHRVISTPSSMRLRLALDRSGLPATAARRCSCRRP